MMIETLTVGMFQTNCFLAWDDTSRDGVIIDPGAEGDRILAAVDRSGMKPRAILLTHGHGDHIAAVAEVKDSLDLPVYIGRGEEPMLADPDLNMSAAVGFPVTAPTPDHSLEDEQDLKLGTLQFTVLSTPGHTEAGVSFLNLKANAVFTGDTLFWGSIGRTDLGGGSLPVLLESIRTKLLRLPDAIACYPGHGPATTIGAERAGNPFLSDDFLSSMA